MTALHRKLVRDVIAMRGQVLTITLVIACGIAAFVTLRGSWTSLISARDAYYERQGFADVFAALERAPDSVAVELERIEGVAQVHTRIVEAARVLVEGEVDPPAAVVIGLERPELPQLNRPQLMAGRLPEIDEHDEVLLLKSFAAAHEIDVGDRIATAINGRQRELTVVGIAMSPEHVFTMTPGSLSADPARFGVLWMLPATLEATFDMKGAFNDVAFRLQPGASTSAVVADVDRALEPYGGMGAIERENQASHHMLMGEADFLLKIVAKDWDAFQRFLTTKLTPAPLVSNVKTALVIRTRKRLPGVPIDEDPEDIDQDDAAADANPAATES